MGRSARSVVVVAVAALQLARVWLAKALLALAALLLRKRRDRNGGLATRGSGMSATPVAHNTRARLRKRKQSIEFLELKSPERRLKLKPRAAATVAQGKENLGAQQGMDMRKSSLGPENAHEKKLAPGASPAANENGISPLQPQDMVKEGGTLPGEDEASLAAQPPAEVQPVCLKPEELVPLEDQVLIQELAKLETYLGCTEWLEQHVGTTVIRKLLKFHPKESKEALIPQVSRVLQFLKTGIESLRSTQSRNAIYAMAQLFETLETDIPLDIPENQQAIDAVLLKSVCDKQFLASASEEALEQIAAAAPSMPMLVALLLHSGSKNAKICAVVSKFSRYCLRGIINKASGSAMIALDKRESLVTVVQGFADLESSRSVDAKKSAQDALRLLNATLTSESFKKIAQEALAPPVAKHIIATVQKGHKKESSRPSLKDVMAAKRREKQQTLQSKEVLLFPPPTSSALSSKSNPSSGEKL